MPTGMLLWTGAMVIALWGLVSALRYRVVSGACLILAGLALGLLSSTYLD